MHYLNDRKILEVSGIDTINFLQNQSPIVISILDTHGADGSTAITYKARGKVTTGNLYINTSFNTQSNISVYEVAPN